MNAGLEERTQTTRLDIVIVISIKKECILGERIN